jgi:hypothetical protein
MDTFFEHDSPTLDKRADLFQWVDELLTACLLLCRSSSRDVRSVSVSLPLRSSPEAEAHARERVRRIAEEYGQAWTAHFAGGGLTVTFARRTDPSRIPDTHVGRTL